MGRKLQRLTANTAATGFLYGIAGGLAGRYVYHWHSPYVWWCSGAFGMGAALLNFHIFRRWSESKYVPWLGVLIVAPSLSAGINLAHVADQLVSEDGSVGGALVSLSAFYLCAGVLIRLWRIGQ
jgi:hypothetical protein